MMDTFTSELRHAIQALLRRPAFTLTAIATLALGIGATAAVYSVVDTILLHPLPYAEPERLIVVRHVVPEIASGEWGMSQVGYFHFREHAEKLEDIGAYWSDTQVLTGDGPPQSLEVASVTASVLSTLGVSPELGRPIGVDDDRRGAARVVLLSHGLWTQSFGADPAVVGRDITLEGERHEVIGVMPAVFRFPAPATDAWVPARFDPAARPVNQHTFPGVARVKAGVSTAAAAEELAGLVSRWPEEIPTVYGGFIERAGFQVVTRPLLDDAVDDVRTLLWIVLAAAVIVLIVACSNVANLMILRAEGRRLEAAMRAALGASRAALLRYSLSEAAVLSLASGVVGLALAWVGVRLLVLNAPPGLPRIEEITLQPVAVLVAVLAVVVVSATLGVVSNSRFGEQLAVQIKSGGRSGTPDRRRLRVRGAFVVTQVSMAVLLAVGSGVLLRSFLNVRAVDPGFSPDNVMTLRLSISPTKYADDGAAFRFFEQVSESIGALPGVQAVGAVTALPLVHRAADNVNEFGDLPGGAEETMLFDTKFAGPGYVEAQGMRLLEGRTLQRRDMAPETGGALVTRALAEQVWPGETAVGKRVRPLMRDYPWHTVVGVIEDVRTEDLRRAPEPTVYFPYSDLAWSRSFFFAVRTQGPPEPLLPAIRDAVWALDADVPLASVTSMEGLVADHMSRTSFTLTLVGVAAATALFLCAVGIYGVIAYTVRQRHFEIGVRMALGARGPQVAGMVLRQTLLLAGGGIVLGTALALAATGLMESLLFEVAAADPLTLVAVALSLGAIAILAGALPARRATRVDAIVALQRD